VARRRMWPASLTPPSMAKPTEPSNLLCSILSPYPSHLQKIYIYIKQNRMVRPKY
jgi:hypothetical protein